MKTFLIFALFTHSVICHADIIVEKNGDRIIGNVANEHFLLQTPYSGILIKKEFVKRISLESRKTDSYTIQSVSNDVLTGYLLSEKIDIVQDSDNRLSLEKERISQIIFDTYGRTYETDTTLFFMKNNDKFSGTLLNRELRFRTGSVNTTIKQEDINRIEYTEPDSNLTITLNNGSIFQGELLEERIRISPDSIHRLTVCTENFRVIQFNAVKLISRVLEESPYTESDTEHDTDGDGINDDSDLCQDTPCSVLADKNGCPPDSDGDGIYDYKDECPKTLRGLKTDEKGCPLDSDADGIYDGADKCPGTPGKAKADENGCWMIQDILFDFDEYRIKSQYNSVLDEVIAVIKENPSLKIEIHGHSDDIGTAAYNQHLSEKRAKAVRAYLLKSGTDEKHLTIVGYGFAKPKVLSKTKTGRALNRRVEIIQISR